MIATLAITTLVLWLLIAEPLLGRRSHRRMLQALDRREPHARRRFYLQWTWQGWLLVAITALVACGAAGWTGAELGLRWPAGSSDMPLGVIAGMGVSMLAGALIAAVAAKRAAAGRKRTPPPVAGGQAVLRMLPRTRDERWAFAALAVTAGVGEEFVWRGFGLAVLQHVWPALHPAIYVVLLAVPFGWAHLYQGWSGVLVTGVVGAVMAGLYLASGSLLMPVLLHVLIDLRALLVKLPPDTPEASPDALSTAADAAPLSRDR
ncbi:MAG TPA: CPBP family intramembrane glutamic endopeptidase [Dyella sp.]|nr:CPBP family intramembrane glutamic endopeptidase [Dyella sp.]